MTVDARTTLLPGDLLCWVPPLQEGFANLEFLVVAEDEESLLYQFGDRPWHEYPDQNGVTVAHAQMILRGELSAPFEGHIFKAYDNATGRSFPDPELEVSE